MAIRTNKDRVKEVLDPAGDYKPGKPLDPFIRVANLMVNQVQAAAPDYDLDAMSTETALEVETWLAAWAYKMSDLQLANSSRGRASATYRGQAGMGLEANSYGQVAMQLDSTGLLGAMNTGRLVGTSWVGKTADEMLTYAERNWSSS